MAEAAALKTEMVSEMAIAPGGFINQTIVRDPVPDKIGTEIAISSSTCSYLMLLYLNNSLASRLPRLPSPPHCTRAMDILSSSCTRRRVEFKASFPKLRVLVNLIGSEESREPMTTKRY
jgi:hypothetical protein